MKKIALLLPLGLLACQTTQAPEPIAVAKVSLAKLAFADGRDAGVATLSQQSDGLWLKVSASGLTPGTYGIHLHSVGRCEAPDFASAGPHWNPEMKQHGFDNPMGAHAGDFRNLIVGTDGRGGFEAKLPGMIDGAIDVDGLALVIHEKPDDYKTDPSGNSGKREICGVFGAD